MNRQVILAILLSLLALSLHAQRSKDSIYVSGTVADRFTKAAVPKAFVTLMNRDSTVVDTAHVSEWNAYTYGIGKGAANTSYTFLISRNAHDYIIKVEHPNYETAYLPFTMKKVSRRIPYVEAPKVYMKRTTRTNQLEGGELGEVVVKATKVKMVWKGDTLVFNADAFNVPEGSMLDGLIKQLPGVELRDDGEIFVNGKKIDNLTLNGADFFKGKNKVMLDNLPYFTVKNVEVYNKQTEENKFLGITAENKKEFTMNVILKREYNMGGTANIEVGYGTDNRYKLKGFGLRFSDRTRAVLFGGLNNVNETMDYHIDRSSYEDRRDQSGNRHFRQVGGQFVYQAPEDKLSNATEVKASWQNILTETRQQSETYLNEASTFGQSQFSTRSKPSQVELGNTFRMLTGDSYHLFNIVRLGYDRSRDESEGWSLSTADAMMTDSINRSWYRSRSQSDRFYGFGNIDLSHKLTTGDAISIHADGNFNHYYTPDAWSISHYDYYKTGKNDHRDRYTHSPSNNYNYSAELSYRYQLTNEWSLRPILGLASGSNRSNRHEYLRDSVDYQFDAQNSYEQRTKTRDYKVELFVDYHHQFKKSYLSIYGTMPVRFQRQRMNYDSEPLTTEITRHYTLINPYVGFFLAKQDWSRELQFAYNMSPTTPSVTDLIDHPITSDPLNIYIGNPNLKKSERHSGDLSYTIRRDSLDQNIRFRIDGNFTHNERTQGYTYDLTTGVRTYRPENISSGNWSVGGSVNYNSALGKQKFFHIGQELEVRYTKSTGLALTAGSASSKLSRVGNVLVSYKPNLRYQKKDLTLNLKGELNYRNIHRNITMGNQPTDIWDFNYGVNGSYKLPWDFVIDTDLTMNSRRGYADEEMNDNRLYWDASLTKSFHQGRWVMKLRGYDLLGQVSNLRYSINAQGRTETWTNTMKRYALLTVSYRFSHVPKKK